MQSNQEQCARVLGVVVVLLLQFFGFRMGVDCGLWLHTLKPRKF
jgi:hypothetical protein